MRAVTESTAEAIFLTDPQGRVTYANPEAERLAGWRQEELIGQVLHDVVQYRRPDGRPFHAWESPLMHVLRSGGAKVGHEEVFYRRDGSAVDVDCSSAPVVVQEKIVGAVMLVRDITTRKRTDRTLRDNEARLRDYGAEVTRYGDGLGERVRALTGDSVDRVFDMGPGGALAELVAIAGDPQHVLTISDFAEAGGLGVKATGGPGTARRWDALDHAAALVEQGEAGARSCDHADGDGVVEGDDRVVVQAEQHAVERRDLRPVRRPGVVGFVVDRGDRCLELVGPGRSSR